MGPRQAAGDEILATVGHRVITVASLVGLLQRQRAVIAAEGAGELLIRFFDDKPETIPIPYPHPGIALRGMSHVPDAGLVLSIQCDVDRDTFTAIAALPDGTGTVFMGDIDGPVMRVANGFQRLPLMHLVMTKISCGTAIPVGETMSVSDWLLCSAVTTVAEELVDVRFDDTVDGPLLADSLLRERISDRIVAIECVDGAPMRLRSVRQDWPALYESAPLLAGLDWADVDDERFAAARGASVDQGKWWTAQGLASLELISLPHVEDNLARLELQHPGVAAHLRRAADAFAERINDAMVPARDRLRARWRADDPMALTRFVRKVVAETDFPFGQALVGYRRRGGQLQQVIRIDSVMDEHGLHALDPTGIDSVSPADGVVMIAKTNAGWTASALNREQEHGIAASNAVGIEFLAPISEGQSLAMMRRVLAGRAPVQPVCAPHEWLCRRILYGVALTLETGKVDGEKQSETPSNEERRLATLGQLADHESPMSLLIDAVLTVVFIEHVDTFVSAMRSGPSLTAVRDDTLSDDERWETFSTLMKLVRELDWSHLRVEALAEAWRQPLTQAQWWGAEGIAYLQARRMPEPTESLLRCAFVIGRGQGAAVAFEHLIARTRQVFGDDMAVLWDLLPDFDT
ncbi:hypothetical protein M2272_001063 [Mycobacterium frederiksbergense]|uniref:Uncharacterized protein n=1 Tax=Mycolicibacterium frederiksbergense TaxID=117567 RepID=A0ABT6KUV5_9MYCO|nr:hypothetical protein [Mycolicibacterium frederiksbergense]MDH6194434.1 hypothetical protein [Mycolicibacterium frederiksbergense]